MTYFYSKHGFTLIELLFVIAIVAILASISAPGFQSLIANSKSDTVQSTLRTAIYRTRTAAITQKKIVTLCPFGESVCTEDWSKGVMIFTDENNNRILDDDDVLLERIYFEESSLEIHWRASAGRNFLRYSPTGMAREFGRFSICSKKEDMTLARGMLLNRQGRLRLFRDRDKDRIVEDIDGSLPECN